MPDVSDEFLAVHGSISSLAYLVILPLGAIVIRIPFLARKLGGVWTHAAIQALGFILVVVGAGLGIYAAQVQEELKDAHPIIGMVLLGILFTQPFTGYLHHLMWKKTGGRTATSWEHITIGRVAIILGMINGGLGIMLNAEVPTRYIAAYGVVAGVMGTIYLASIAYGEYARTKDTQMGKSPEMRKETS